MEKTPFWPIDFFYKGLVIHVVFSLVIWLQCIFAFLVSVATLRLAGDDVRAAPARTDRAGRGSRRFSLPVRAGLSRGDAARAHQLHSDHSPSGLRHRPSGAGPGRARAGRSSFDQSAGTACLRAAARSRNGAWRLRLSSGADLFRRRRNAARGEGELASRDGTVLGRRSRAAIRLRCADGDELVDPCAHEPRRRGGRQPRLPRLRRPHRADRDRGAGVLRGFLSVLRRSARGVPPAAVRHRRADAYLRGLACRPRPPLAGPDGHGAIRPSSRSRCRLLCSRSAASWDS